GWKLVGFPGVPSGAYKDHLDNPAPYRVEPVSILDVLENRVKLDAEGYPKHVMLNEQLPEGGNEAD
ncbi:MAG: hypothetical protein ACXW20_16675, partial [Burkholderiales bacterium]